MEGDEVEEAPEIIVNSKTLAEIGVMRIPNGDQEFFVVGTAHVSDESCEDVRKAVRSIQPDTLMVELCRQRAGLLFPTQHKAEEASTMSQIKQTMKERQGLSGVFQLLLGHLYKKVGQEIKIQPGAEFRAALEEVQHGYVPCRLVLGDRAIGVTIQRAWALLPIREKLMLVFQLVRGMFSKIGKDDIERMKQSDVLADLMIEFSLYFPSLATVLLKERDIFLARSLYECTGKRVLAVVGLGHVKGMQDTVRRWQRDPSLRETECKNLMYVPPTSWTGRRMVLALLVVVVLLGLGAFYGVCGIAKWYWGT